jgi:hypothetical protein
MSWANPSSVWPLLPRAAMRKIGGVDYPVQQVASHDYTTVRASFPIMSLQGRVDAVAQCRGVERLREKADSTRCDVLFTNCLAAEIRP